MTFVPRKPEGAASAGGGHRAEGWLATAFLLFAIVFQAVLVAPEVTDPVPSLNDHILHLLLTQATAEAMMQGQDPSDPWLSNIALGFPLSHHYQHLPHLVLAGVYWLLGGSVSIAALLRVSMLLMLTLFPLSLRWTMRRLGCDVVAASFAGVAGVLLSTNRLFGLDLSSYGWAGIGLITMLCGVVLLGPCWVVLDRALNGKTSLALAAALSAMLLLTHTVLGYVALLSTVLFLFAPGLRGLGRRMGRLVVITCLAAAVLSYFLVPFFLDRSAMNRSVWEDTTKYDAFGARWTLEMLFSGSMLDDDTFHRRLPVLTVLAALGCITTCFQWKRRTSCRLIPLLALFWLLLFFGRPTWGRLLDLLPLSGDLHFHRLIAPFHLAATGLVGLGLGWLWRLQAIRRIPDAARLVLLAAGTSLVLAPAFVERKAYIETRNSWLKSSRDAIAADASNFQRLLEDLRKLPDGRVYAGLATNWGKSYAIGSVHVYDLIAQAGLDQLGYLYHALSLNADIQGYLDESRPAHFDLFNVRYVVAPEERSFAPFIRPSGRFGRHRLYTVQTTGYFDLVDRGPVFEGERSEWFTAARDWLHSQLVETGVHPVFFFSEARTEYARVHPMAEAKSVLDRIPIDRNKAPCGSLSEESVQMGRYETTAEVTRPCYLMLKATYHPRWRVEVDGAAVEPVMLAPSFVGVPLEAGRRRVVFEYRPRALRPVLMVMGLLTLAAAAVLERNEEVREWARKLLVKGSS